MSEISVDKASRLFRYLAELVKKSEKVVTKSSQYDSDGGRVVHVDDLVRSSLEAENIHFGRFVTQGYPNIEENRQVAEHGVIVVFKKPSVVDFPPLGDHLVDFVTGSLKDPNRRPQLSPRIGENFDNEKSSKVLQELELWLREWDRWAKSQKQSAAYQSAFDMQMSANQHADEFELVLGLCTLAWVRDSFDINRHLFSIPLKIEIDKHSGDISIRLEHIEFRMEFEIVPRAELIDSNFTDDVRRELQTKEWDELCEEAFASVGQVTANGLGTNAVYQGKWAKPVGGENPILVWDPVIILRKRQRVGLSTAFEAIAGEIENTQSVPKGLAPLIDPNQQVVPLGNASPGAIQVIDGELFSPLPLNAKQKEVLKRVDTHSQTIVQGPPGTGKTHMAAALLSHLLAQGARVLVTAHADRALYELRDKLPAEIRELAVSVISSNQSDLSDLKSAIDTINRKSSEFDLSSSERDQAILEREISRLQTQRVRKTQQWTECVRAEQNRLDIQGYREPMAEAVRLWIAKKEEFSWIKSLDIPNLKKPFPLSTEELETWFKLISDSEIKAESVCDDINFSSFWDLPSVAQLRTLFEEEKERIDQRAMLSQDLDFKFFDQVKRLDANAKSELRETAVRLDSLKSEVLREDYEWFDALHEALSKHKVEPLLQTEKHLEECLAEVRKLATTVQSIKKIDINGGVDGYFAMAEKLLDYLKKSGDLKTQANGMPKIGFMTNRVVKDCNPFFENVSINGKPPTTEAAVSAYLSYVKFQWEVDSLYSAWNYTAPEIGLSPSEVVYSWEEKIGSFKDSIARVIEICDCMESFRSKNVRIGWDSIDTLYQRLKDCDEYQCILNSLNECEIPIQSLLNRLAGLLVEYPDFSPIDDLYKAVDKRNLESYEAALDSVRVVEDLSQSANQLNLLSNKISSWSPTLVQKIKHPEMELWRSRLSVIEEARKWALVGLQIERRNTVDLEDLSVEIKRIDDQITKKIGELAALRAWSKAVGASRIDQRMRSNLVAYNLAVKQLGKGTGKNADLHRRNARKHLESCRAAIPVWIMPIYKVVEQFELEEDMFDVVIVDEASQAGMESVFLQYLAPRIVVIGDDKQVSPAAVGTKTDEIYALANQYIADFEHKDSWTNPELSLFDSANQRYGGRIVLNEHRRCVPEIIEFSNRFIYEPENMPLKPVRQVLPGRLAPFRITRTPLAYYSATTKNKVNTKEADALVDRLLKVLDDPDYEGKSLGVISLLSSSGQAKYIQSRLLEKIPPNVWEDRDLKVGKPEDFQGAERDVVFLSMVQPSSGGRITALTREMYLQRYNVAVSRAKDQVWLFHSVSVDELNPEDIRFKLLNYAYKVAEAKPEINGCELVNENEHVEPFDSLFEQRVYNEVVRKGFRVIPQYPASGYRLDLVVETNEGRLAIECDGDHWHGDDQIRNDQIRQRELERLGWKFVRIFESDFYLDREGQMQRVWRKLEELNMTAFSPMSGSDAEAKNIEIVDDEDVVMDIELEPFSPLEQPESTKLSVDQASIELVDSVDLTGGYEMVNEDIYSHESVAVITDRDSGNWVAEAEGASGTEAIKSGQPAYGEQAYEMETRLELKEYRVCQRELASLRVALPAEIQYGILEVLVVEGPMTGDFLGKRMAKLGGDAKCGKLMRQALEKEIVKLVRSGKVETTGPVNRRDVSSWVLKIPGTEDFSIRELGPRTIYEVPESELIEQMRRVVSVLVVSDTETAVNAVARIYGVKRLSQKKKELFERVYLSIQEDEG